MFRLTHKFIWLAPALVLAAFLSGCDDMDKYFNRLGLTPQQKEQARPILEIHQLKQNQLFELLKNKKTDGPPSDMQHSGQSRSQMNRPDHSKMRANMEKKKAEMEIRFEENDQQAAQKLSNILDENQLELFLLIAKESREEKSKEMMEQQQDRPSDGPGNGQGGGRGGPGGPPRGGMGVF